MTAEEIRSSFKHVVSPEAQAPIVETQTTDRVLMLQEVLFLQEIAAQMAELNERLKPGSLEMNIYDCTFEDTRKARAKVNTAQESNSLLKLLSESRQGLDGHRFNSTFIGILSNRVPPEIWRDAVAATRQYLTEPGELAPGETASV